MLCCVVLLCCGVYCWVMLYFDVLLLESSIASRCVVLCCVVFCLVVLRCVVVLRCGDSCCYVLRYFCVV